MASGVQRYAPSESTLLNSGAVAASLTTSELFSKPVMTAASATAPASVFLSDDAYSPTNTFDELLSSIVPSVLYAL